MKIKLKKKYKEIILALPFIIVMFYMAVIGLIFPLRPTVSSFEKRTLAVFPEFSFSAFLSGSYTDDISYWFSDTFPGRESWLKIAGKESRLHGFNSTYVDPEKIKKSDEIPQVSVSSLPESESDENILSSAEISDEQNDFIMDDQETEFSDINLDTADIEIYSSAFLINDTVYAFQCFDENASSDYLEYINSFAESAERRGYNFYNVIAPTSAGIILPEDLRTNLGCADQGEILDYIFCSTYPSVKCVNCYDILKDHCDEYIYYHTDHHWTGLGAYYAYLAFCESSGKSPVSLNDYAVIEQGDFLGSFAATAALSGRVKLDTVTAYSPPGNIHMSFGDTEDSTSQQDVITNIPAEDVSNKYNTYIGGDRRLTILTNENIRSGPDCLLIKDSFGNPFSVYLTEHYRNVYVVDYRKIEGSVLDLAEKYGTADIILCQSIGVSQSRSANGLLGQILR